MSGRRHGGAGLVVSSQTGYMMNFPQEVEQQLALTPAGELADPIFHLKILKESFIISVEGNGDIGTSPLP